MTIRTLAFAAALVIALPSAMQAAVLLLFDSPTGLALSPGTVQFSGFGANAGEDEVYINGYQVAADPIFAIDDTGLFFNLPVSLPAGEFFAGEFFSVSVPSGVAYGLYQGSLLLFGGTSPGDGEIIAEALFDVFVTEPAGGAVPEPATFLTGLAGLAIILTMSALRSRGAVKS